MSEKEERQRFVTLWWAGALIWAGLVFAADSLGWLPQIGKADAWSWVFLGAGLQELVGDLYRLASVSHLNPTTWDWVFAGFLLIVGLAGVAGVNMFWPLVLILFGVAFLISMMRRKQGVSIKGKRQFNDNKQSEGGLEMSAILAAVERNHRLIILALVGVIVFFLLACTFHDVLPICHYLFGCDHGMHAQTPLSMAVGIVPSQSGEGLTRFSSPCSANELGPSD